MATKSLKTLLAKEKKDDLIKLIMQLTAAGKGKTRKPGRPKSKKSQSKKVSKKTKRAKSSVKSNEVSRAKYYYLKGRHKRQGQSVISPTLRAALAKRNGVQTPSQYVFAGRPEMHVGAEPRSGRSPSGMKFLAI